MFIHAWHDSGIWSLDRDFCLCSASESLDFHWDVQNCLWIAVTSHQRAVVQWEQSYHSVGQWFLGHCSSGHWPLCCEVPGKHICRDLCFCLGTCSEHNIQLYMVALVRAISSNDVWFTLHQYTISGSSCITNVWYSFEKEKTWVVRAAW